MYSCKTVTKKIENFGAFDQKCAAETSWNPFTLEEDFEDKSEDYPDSKVQEEEPTG